VHIKDVTGNTFATRTTNVFVIGKGSKSLVSLPRGKGVKKTILEEAEALEKRKNEVKKSSIDV